MGVLRNCLFSALPYTLPVSDTIIPLVRGKSSSLRTNDLLETRRPAATDRPERIENGTLVV